MLRKMRYSLLKWLVKLFVSMIAGTILLILVYALPVKPMRENVARSSGIFDYERIYPELVYGYRYMRLDNYTDSIMLGAAIYEGEEPLLERVMQNYHIDSNDLAPDMALTNYANEVAVYEYYKTAYGRYWHGYLVPLKLLLLFFDYGDIRVLNFFLQNILLYIVAGLFVQNRQKKYIPAYILGIFVLNPLTTALSLQFSTVYYIVLLSSICLLREYRNGKPEDAKVDNLCFFTGIATSYFDFLTYPLVGAGVLLTLYLNLSGERIERKHMKSCIRKLVLWGAGYGGMWCGKWLMGSLLTGENFFQNAWRQGKFRASVEEYTRIGAVLKNIQVFFKWPFVFLFLMLAAGCAVMLRKGNLSIWRRNRMGILGYTALALLPVIWIFVLANHSWEHYWFTYREFAISCFAMLSLAAYLESDFAGGG